VSQLYYKGNHVGFTLSQCLITNIKSGEVVLRGKRHNNVYKTCVLELPQNRLTYLNVLDDDNMPWHKKLGRASLSLLNKLVSKSQVFDLPSIKYNDDNVCDACAKEKQTRIAFKSKKYVSTSRPLEPLYIDLCGPMRITSRGGKRHVLFDETNSLIENDVQGQDFDLGLARKDNGKMLENEPLTEVNAKESGQKIDQSGGSLADPDMDRN